MTLPYFLNSGSITLICLIMIILPAPYNRSVERVVQDEGPALGVAILAGVACGLYESVEKACDQLITRRDSTEPKAEDVAVYEKYHRLYQKLYTSLKNDYKELAELS